MPPALFASRRPYVRLVRSVVVLAAALASPALVRAQSSATSVPRTTFESVRYREDWSRAPQGDPLDPLKHIAIADDTWLSFGGHLRGRVERDDNFQGGGAGTRTNSFELFRTHLHADLHATAHLRFFVEGRLATARDRDLPGGIRITDRDDGDFLNAFGELNALPFADALWTLRVGRQEMLFGRERIVSPSDWSNVKRTFQGAVVEGHGEGWMLAAFATHPVTLIPAAMDVPDVHTAFWGAELTLNERGHARVTELFAYVRGIDASGTTPFAQRTTLGVRSLAPIGETRLAYEVEGGMQVGATGNTSVTAVMFDGELSASWKGRFSPVVTLGGTYASGSNAGVTVQANTWDQLFPLAHSYLGYADVLGRKNVVEERVVMQMAATPQLRLRASVHAFQRANTGDAAYDATGAVLRAPGTSTAAMIGKEVDLTAQWRVTSHLRLDGGLAHFRPGAFLAETGAALPYTWAFGSVTATF